MDFTTTPRIDGVSHMFDKVVEPVPQKGPFRDREPLGSDRAKGSISPTRSSVDSGELFRPIHELGAMNGHPQVLAQHRMVASDRNCPGKA